MNQMYTLWSNIMKKGIKILRKVVCNAEVFYSEVDVNWRSDSF